MPVEVRRVDGKYSVSTPGGTKAAGTTKKKAQRQARLLRAIDHGWKPTQEFIRSTAQALVSQLLDGEPRTEKALERHRTERTVLRGGRYGSGVKSKGKTAGKFAFPRNFRVGHAIKS